MSRKSPAQPPTPASPAEAQRAFDAASAAHRRGDVKAAEAGYRNVLAAQPGHFDALHMLGVIEAQRGKLAAAADLLERARGIDAGHAGVHNNLANALCGLGRQAEALELFRRAAELDPAYADPLCNLGQALLDLGRPAEALDTLERAIEIRPDLADAHFRRAMVLAGLGRLEEALRGYERVIAIRPVHAEAHCNRGNLLCALDRVDEALVSHDRAVAANPESAQAHCFRSNTLRMLGHAADALAGAERAIRLQPGMAAAHCMKGLALSDLGRHEEAIACLDRAIALQPDHVESLNGRGSALNHLGRTPPALACFDRALALRPGDPLAQANRAVALKDLGRLDEALAAIDAAIAQRPGRLGGYNIRAGILTELNRAREALADYERALALQPGHVEAAWNQSVCRLLLGDFERGWPGYEIRWRAVPRLGRIAFRQPQWAGERVEGTLLAWGEQGIGDQVLHLGMVDALKEMARRVVVAVEPRLVALAQRSFPEIEVIGLNRAAREPCDAQVPLGSIGQYVRRRLQDFPAARESYLVADEARVKELRGSTKREGVLACGLSWISAAPQTGVAKSMTLDALLQLLRMAGLHFIDLQYGETAAERDALRKGSGIDIARVAGVENFADLDGLAALICACDFVVTVSNTTAHLAGALGRPVFLLLPFSSGRLWYWHEGRADSPWYPATRIFRQDAAGDWRGAVERARAAIAVRYMLGPGRNT